eukprot:295258-Prorocentrum_minimum.AAC.1
MITTLFTPHVSPGLVRLSSYTLGVEKLRTASGEPVKGQFEALVSSTVIIPKNIPSPSANKTAPKPLGTTLIASSARQWMTRPFGVSPKGTKGSELYAGLLPPAASQGVLHGVLYTDLPEAASITLSEK